MVTKKKEYKKLKKTYGDSYNSTSEHQTKNEVFMDRDFYIIHQDLKKIIELLEKK
jgi:hypothetical protein